MSNHGDPNLQSSIETTEDQRPKKNELDKNFVIEEMYGTKGAFPSGTGATLVLAMVHITYTPATQVPSSLESFAFSSQDLEERPSNIYRQDSPCSSSAAFNPISTAKYPPKTMVPFKSFASSSQGLEMRLSYPYLQDSPFSPSAAFSPGSPAEYPPEGMVPMESTASRSQRLEETFSNLCLQDSPCSSTPSSPVSAEESRCTWIFRNEFKSHAEIKLLRRLEREVQRLEQEGNKVKINVELISNYAPCHECADELITFKETMEREGKEVSIKVIFANYYYWIGRHYTKEYGWKNLLKSKKIHDKGIDLKLLQGKESWESLFEDSDLVNVNDGEKEELLKKATSEKRQEREDYDRNLRDEEKLF